MYDFPQRNHQQHSIQPPTTDKDGEFVPENGLDLYVNMEPDAGIRVLMINVVGSDTNTAGATPGNPATVPTGIPTTFPTGIPTTVPTGNPIIAPTTAPTTVAAGGPSGITITVPSAWPPEVSAGGPHVNLMGARSKVGDPNTITMGPKAPSITPSNHTNFILCPGFLFGSTEREEQGTIDYKLLHGAECPLKLDMGEAQGSRKISVPLCQNC